MDVLVLIDKLDDLVHNAKPVPLTDQVRVDKEEIYDILDQMRATIPEEIKQARWIVKERQEMLAEAKREAERIVKEARERQEQADLRGGDHQASRARRRGHHRGRPRPRARDPARRRGLRRRDPQHARGQPLEVHRRGAARARPARRQGRAGRGLRPGGRSSPRSADPEAGQALGRLVADVDVLDAGVGRSLADELQHPLDGAGTSLEHRLDRPVGAVGDPAGDAVAGAPAGAWSRGRTLPEPGR